MCLNYYIFQKMLMVKEEIYQEGKYISEVPVFFKAIIKIKRKQMKHWIMMDG